jgi:hypothetical protein
MYSGKTIFTVLGYTEEQDCHRCKDENDNTVQVDLMTDGTIARVNDEDYVDFCKSLVGRRVEVDYTTTYLHMAANPQLLEQ